MLQSRSRSNNLKPTGKCDEWSDRIGGTPEEGKRPSDPAGVYRPARVCHIVDSIKNEAELEALRLVYRDMLHCIGVFSPMPHREEHLKTKGMELHEIYKRV